MAFLRRTQLDELSRAGSSFDHTLAMRTFVDSVYRRQAKGGFIRHLIIQGFCLLVVCENVALNITPFFALRRYVARLFGVNLSKGVAIHSPVRLLDVGKLTVGVGTTIGFGCLLDNRRGISVGSNVAIAHRSSIYTLGHDVDAADFSVKGAPVIIEDDVCLFAHSMVMPGVRIGRGAVVYAGSVVTRDVPAYAIVGGNPARILRQRTRALNYKVNGRFWFAP
jgi:acetyltransferase-like isoleucine patch superfamily enzyme